MAKKPVLHSYSDRHSFERLLLLITTFICNPGIGCSSSEQESGSHHQALQQVKKGLQQTANELNIDLPDYSVSTLRKDLETLRRYGILNRRMYRWGYYLGTGAMTQSELQLMLQALHSQAQYQGDSQIRNVYKTLERRLRGLDLELDGELFYPVRTYLNRTIVHTDPEEMMQQGQYRHTLFHQLEVVEQAIATGQSLEVYRCRNPYGTLSIGHLQIYPLQLIYADIAWYLLYEHVHNKHLEIERIDRLSDQVHVLDEVGRGLAAQQASLQIAHKLLVDGWGLYLGQPEEQQQERLGQVEPMKVVVRFFPPIMTFILEGERRHPRQKLRKGASRGNAYVDYTVELPARSLGEFSRWICRFLPHAKVLTPPELVAQHREVARQLIKLYD